MRATRSGASALGASTTMRVQRLSTECAPPSGASASLMLATRRFWKRRRVRRDLVVSSGASRTRKRVEPGGGDLIDLKATGPSPETNPDRDERAVLLLIRRRGAIVRTPLTTGSPPVPTYPG